MKFTQEHEEIRRTMKKFIDAEINPHVDEWEAAEQFPAHEVFKKLGLTKPEAYGGAALDYSYSMVFAETLGQIRFGGVPMAIVMEGGARRKGIPVDEAKIADLKKLIIENFERQQSAFVTSASLLDDGIIDPRDTRNVLGFTLSVCKDGDTRSLRPLQFGVARP